jgi:DNA-binding transcriptional LysR family regulator
VELRHLRYFVVVAEELHFGRAAARLHMAQSPLSQQIRDLETELGVRLIERAQRVVGLTDAGKAFLESARSVLAEADDAATRARRADRGEVGTLRVGYVGEVTVDLLPLALRTFKDQHPDIAIELLEATTSSLLDQLRRDRLDVVFIRFPHHLDDFAFEQLVEESLMLATPQADGHAPLRTVAELDGTDLVVPSDAAARGLRADIDSALRTAGVRANVTREATSLTAVLLHVAAGAGRAIIPASIAHLYPVPGVEYSHFDEPVPITRVGLAWLPDDESPLLARFLEATRETANHHLGQPDVWPERRVRPGSLSEGGTSDSTP